MFKQFNVPRFIWPFRKLQPVFIPVREGNSRG
jgi:hypothetical protein